MKKIFVFVVLSLTTISTYAQKEEYLRSVSNVIHLTSYGEGEPILIINGGPGMNSEGFKYLAKIIGRTNRAIIYDQRGTGKSKIPRVNKETITIDAMVNDIEIIRKHLKLDQWVVLGHSFGGMLASYYAATYPDRIKGLILSSSGGINMDLFARINITARLSRTERDSLQYWNAQINKGDTTYHARLQRGKYLAPAYVFNKANVPAIAERLTQGNPTINQLVYQSMRHIDFDCTEGLKQLKIPVLIIQGKEDLIDRTTAETAINALENPTLVLLEKCGHYGWLDQPKAYFESIDNYLKQLDIL